MEFLRCFGYRYRDVEEALWLLGRRFQSYKQKAMEFPHEMGIFLGYPLGDVKGFIRHRGRIFCTAGTGRSTKMKQRHVNCFLYIRV